MYTASGCSRTCDSAYTSATAAPPSEPGTRMRAGGSECERRDAQDALGAVFRDEHAAEHRCAGSMRSSCTEP